MKKIYLENTLALLLAVPITGYSQPITEDEITYEKSDSKGQLVESEAGAILEEVIVSGQSEENLAIETKTRDELEKEMVGNNVDLLRYSVDAGLVDSGRNQKGFALRGVEGNRVGITFDNVNIPNSEENSLYARYGNFNASRIQIDPELVRSVELVKGGNSYANGSGSLGGSANYRSLEVFDIVDKENTLGGSIRGGYNEKNKEWFTTIGTGYIGEHFDAVVVASKRKGSETKSEGEGEKTIMSSSQHPDPSKHRNKNYLLKLNYNLTPEHHVGIGLTHQEKITFTDERSYALLPSMSREADDVSQLDTLNMYYEWMPDSSISSVKVEYNFQKTDLGAIGYKYLEDWRTSEKYLDEIYDRRFKTDYHGLSVNLALEPIKTFAGEHTLSLNTTVGRRDFETLAKDTIAVGTRRQDTSIYTIQYPTRTIEYSTSLKDDITWNDTFSSKLGLRYDYTKVTTKDLNAPCSTACLGEGRPEGTSFSNWSLLAGIDAQLNDTWNIGYQINTGYRVPSASEMYFTFKNAYGTWQSNPELESEHSINHTVTLNADNEIGSLGLSLYHNRYRDFLHEQTTLIEKTQWGRTWQTPVTQMVNLDNAKISGLELTGQLDLNKTISAPEGLKLSLGVGYSKGSLSDGSSLLSIQPLKAVLGLDYNDPNERWGASSRLTYLGGKKPKDAQVENVKRRCLREYYDPWFGSYICAKSELYKEIEDFKYLNKPAFVFDIFGYYKPVKNLTLRAGIFNVFNRKYHTWDSLRGINDVSVSNGVDRNGLGLERFYAPGRNFAVSFDYKF